ncbi:MAG: class I SAM-dependent methyltransferase [Myxococcales bacterium]|nr:class I SAM-dependent methyltransferase [Myxococcales bacterium]
MEPTSTMIDHSNLEEYADPLAYDVENTLDEEGDYFLARAAHYGGPVLDVACGTGRLTIPLARLGLRCVGVDVVEAMLAEARRKSEGLPITYLRADARTLALDEQFGFALMTGHAFQAFLSDDDQRAVLAAIHRHLRPGGGLVFENRNPAARVLSPDGHVDWERSYQTADGAWVDAHAITRFDPTTSILHVDQHRVVRATGEVHRSRIALRYCDDAHTRRLLADVGLRVVAVHGDWFGGPVTPTCGDFIYVCERA